MTNFTKMVNDGRCKQNSIKAIDRRIFRNNCRHWSGKCNLGYIPDTKDV